MATQSLEFKSGLDDSKFQAGLKNMEKGAKASTGKISGMMKGAFGATAIIAATKATLDFAGALQDQADIVGIGTEELQGFQGAMSQSGVDSEKFTRGMVKLGESIQQAKEDTGTARESFTKLGITWDDLQKSPIDKILLKIADGLKNAKDPASALAAALDLIGQKNYKMAAALKVGGEEFKKNADQIAKLLPDEVAALDAVGDAWDRAGTMAKVYFGKVMLGLEQLVTKGVGGDVTVQDPLLGDMGSTAAMGAVKGATKKANKSQIIEKTQVDPAIAKQIADRAKEYMEGMRESQKIGREMYEAEKDRNGELIERLEKEKQIEKIKQLQLQHEAVAIRLSKQQVTVAEARERQETAMQGVRDIVEGRRPVSDRREKRMQRMMDAMTGGGPIRQRGLMSTGGLGSTGGLSSGGLGNASAALSARSGSGKALKAFIEAREKTKQAEQRQEEMVKALQAIEKGINGN